MMEEFKILEESSNFISSHSKEISEKYPRKFIAVYRNQLIVVDENFDNIVIRVKEMGLDTNQVLIEYIPGKGEIILY